MKYVLFLLCAIGCSGGTKLSIKEGARFESCNLYGATMEVQKDKENKVECTCNGTKRVKSGDGIIDVPCPCGNSCTCVSQEVTPKPPEPAPTPTQCNCGCNKDNCSCKAAGCIIKKEERNVGRIIYIGADWCEPCRKVKSTSFKVLKEKYSWDIGPEGKDIQVFDYTNAPYQVESVPTFIFVEDGKPVRQKVGYLSAEGIDKFWKNK